MSSKKNVSVFGAYFNGNFGDDLMGLQLAQELKNHGYQPVLWRGPDLKVSGEVWDIATSVDEFLKDTICVVFGGGMVLCDSNFPEYWLDMKGVLDACECRGIPIIGISIGSDGKFDNLNPTAKKFVCSKELKAISLRLVNDVSFVRKLNPTVKIDQYDDIVLCSSFPKPRKNIRKILVCMPVSKIEQQLIKISGFILTLLGREVSSISQFKDDVHESTSFIKFKKHIKNHGVDSVLTAVRDCDLLIGRGLHVGVSALASGASFISYKGTGKTSSFLTEYGMAENHIAKRRPVIRPLMFLILIKKVLNVKTSNVSAVFDRRAKAEKHFEFMISELSKCSETEIPTSVN
jgi:hypothetical protein